MGAEAVALGEDVDQGSSAQLYMWLMWRVQIGDHSLMSRTWRKVHSCYRKGTSRVFGLHERG